ALPISTGPGLWAWSISSRQGFPARTSQMQATERVLRVSAQESGRTSVKQLGYFDPVSSSWKTWQQSAEGDSPLSQKTWPKSGMTCSGRLYELPMPDSRITVTHGSASPYLPTPTARDWKSGASNLHGKNARARSEVAPPYQTPTPSLGRNGAAQRPGKRRGGGHGPTRGGGSSRLLPAPEGDGLAPDWVEYEPALRRQEASVGRQAPTPTELCPRG